MNNSTSDKDKKHFDWGPPSNPIAERLKEWFVYVAIVALLSLGAWFLLDISKETPPQVSTQINITNRPEKDVAIEHSSEESSSTFQVQLGAFSDKDTAYNAYETLKQAGLNPEISEPQGTIQIYRITFGPFKHAQQAEKLVEKLNSMNFHAFVLESI